MLSIVGFLIILAPLVIVHEFGHYFFARLFGVKAEVFSIGFGPTLWSRQCGETELRLSAVPLGGYVKLLGEEKGVELPPDDLKRALHRQAPWKRFFIFLGGPLFNFLWAVVVFVAILLIGEPQIGNIVSRVVPGSMAEKVGFRNGDRVLSIDGKPVQKFEEIVIAINSSPGRILDFEIERHPEEQRVRLKVVPGSQEGFSVYGEMTRIGELEGLLPRGRATTVGVSDPRSIAGKAGVKTGDVLVSIDSRHLKSWEEVESLYQQLALGSEVMIRFRSQKDSSFRDVKSPKLKHGVSIREDWGLASSELFVDKVIEGSPAAVIGLKSGDRLVGIGSKDFRSFQEMREAVQKVGETGKPAVIRWERSGLLMSATISPSGRIERDPLLKKVTQYTIGIYPMLLFSEPETFTERILNPIELLVTATNRVIELSWKNIVSVRKMISGDVSVATLGGPIMIGKIAGESLARGVIAFLSTMAFLSIGLGVLNILPVPVLDGGHLLLLAIETVRGKPLTIRQMEIIQGVGLSLILILMAVVIRNDLARLPLFN